MVLLKEVTAENYRQAHHLKVNNEQEHFVASSIGILARAYAYRDEGGKALFIYNDEEIVGILFYRRYEPEKCYVFDQLMIDERYQRRGFGEAAVSLTLERMKQERKYERVTLCYCEGDNAARDLYLKAGFHPTGECDEDEIVMAMDL